MGIDGRFDEWQEPAIFRGEARAATVPEQTELVARPLPELDTGVEPIPHWPEMGIPHPEMTEPPVTE